MCLVKRQTQLAIVLSTIHRRPPEQPTGFWVHSGTRVKRRLALEGFHNGVDMVPHRVPPFRHVADDPRWRDTAVKKRRVNKYARLLVWESRAHVHCHVDNASIQLRQGSSKVRQMPDKRVPVDETQFDREILFGLQGDGYLLILTLETVRHTSFRFTRPVDRPAQGFCPECVFQGVQSAVQAGVVESASHQVACVFERSYFEAPLVDRLLLSLGDCALVAFKIPQEHSLAQVIERVGSDRAVFAKLTLSMVVTVVVS